MVALLENEEYSKHYGSDSHHSLFLNKHFDLRSNGYDWDSKSGLRVEFKETFMKDGRQFSIFYKDILRADVIVCCNHSYYFYVVLSKVLDCYEYKSKSALAQPSLNTIRKLSMASFKSVLRLKDYLNSLYL